MQVYTDEEGSDESVTSSTGGASASLSQPVSRRSLRMLDALPHSEQAPPLLHLQPAAASTTAAAAVAAAAAAAAPVSPASRRSVQHSKASSPAAARASHSMKHSREVRAAALLEDLEVFHLVDPPAKQGRYGLNFPSRQFQDCGPVTAAAASPASPGNSPTKRRRQDATAAAAAGNRKTSPGAAAKRSHQVPRPTFCGCLPYPEHMSRSAATAHVKVCALALKMMFGLVCRRILRPRRASPPAAAQPSGNTSDVHDWMDEDAKFRAMQDNNICHEPSVAATIC